MAGINDKFDICIRMDAFGKIDAYVSPHIYCRIQDSKK